MGINASNNPTECSPVVLTRFIGEFTSLSALETAHPTAPSGSYAIVNQSGNDVIYYFSTADNEWFTPEGGSGGTTPTLQLVTDEGAQTDKSMIIRNDILDRFLAVAKGSKDLSIFADRLSHSSNVEYSTQLSFQPTLAPAEVSIRNLSGTMALLSDISAVLEGIAWKQPVELLFDTAVTQSGVIPQLSSLTNQGVTLVNGSRVVLSAQANPIYNGIWCVNSTPVSGSYRLYRTDDANTTAELNNAVVGVTSGTHAGKTFRQSTVNPIIGTSNIVFTDFGNTVASATNLVAGISKLYNAIGTETDGGITPNAVKVGLDLKADKAITPVILKNNFSPNTLTSNVTVETIVDSYDLGVGFLGVGESLNLFAEIIKNSGAIGAAWSYFYLSKVANSISVTDAVKIATAIPAGTGNGSHYVERTFNRKSTAILSGRVAGTAAQITDKVAINNIPIALINDANLNDYRFLIVASTYTGTGGGMTMQTNVILTKNPVV